jgi:hypothetical protein
MSPFCREYASEAFFPCKTDVSDLLALSMLSRVSSPFTSTTVRSPIWSIERQLLLVGTKSVNQSEPCFGAQTVLTAPHKLEKKCFVALHRGSKSIEWGSNLVHITFHFHIGCQNTAKNLKRLPTDSPKSHIAAIIQQCAQHGI